MPQSLVKNYVHIIFSTKNREPWILPEYEKEMYSYLSKVSNELECKTLAVGGYVDHVHILCRLSQKIPLMTLVQKVKAHSSKWYKTKDSRLTVFFWQAGYAAFSVKSDDFSDLIEYINNQQIHHKQKGYKTEVLEYLKANQMDFDERYLWD